ncbi:MAG: hypothetical protein ACREM1_20540 [Longimicrobiales bacterium]
MFVNAALALALLQQGGEADTMRVPADSAAVASAYLDEDARGMVRLARERRQLVDRSVERYAVTARARISVGLRALRRDRLFYRREMATHIDWTRDGPVQIDVLGAREVIPLVFSKPRLPDDMDDVEDLAFDPADDRMMIGWNEGDDDNFVRHPLAANSETDYRFRSGDTTIIALPDGRRVRLRELQIIPRRKDVHLIRGSFWLDAESHAVVQAGFRLADEFDLERDAEDPEDVDDVPGILKPIRASVQYITIEYGLWELRWWLPRVVAFEGVAKIGRFVAVPMQYERVYSGYEVTGAAADIPLITIEEHAAQAKLLRDYCRKRHEADEEQQEDDERRRGRGDSAVRDTGAAAVDTTRATDEPPLAPADTALPAELHGLYSEVANPCARYTVNVPSDSAALMTSELLPPDPYAAGVAMVSADEIRELTDRLEGVAAVPWQLEAPSLDWGLGGSGLLRYNRIEGLSIGAQSELDLGRLTATGLARIGVADLEPNVELALARETFGTRYELGGYRRLESMDPTADPFSVTASLSALLLGRDEVDYFRTLGVELRGRPVEVEPQWYEWRVYAQRERAAKKETDFSVRHALDGNHVFPDNARAERATQYGVDLALRTWHGHDPLGFRWGAELGVNAATGTFDYARPSLTLSTAWPLPRGVVGALEVAGGTTFGHGAEQHLWRLGGVTTLRGYRNSATTGESFWRARAELANQFPGARLVLFGDAGRAGETDNLFDLQPLLSAGVGASLLDGLVRIDLARALRSPTGWRLTLSLDGRL